MNLQEAFFDNTGLLRSGWRAVVFILAFAFAAFFLGGIMYVALGTLGFTGEENDRIFLALNGVVSLVIALVVGWLCGKYLEYLPFRALGASFKDAWLRNLALGMLLGVVELALAVGIATAFGGLSFTVNNEVEPLLITSQLASVFLIFAVAAASEEALFRGYILQTFTRAGLAWVAIGLTSLFFGIAHLTNPNVSIIGAVNTALAGVMFAVAYLKTRDLWFPFGMHLMWNWMQGAVFGIEVSGLNDIAGATLLKEIDRGPTWLTGETYGIEGGIACTVSLIAAIVFIQFWPPRGRIFSEPADSYKLTANG